jgi:hypothetical protein
MSSSSRNGGTLSVSEEPGGSDQGKLSLRTALLLTMAVLAACGDAALVALAHWVVPLIVISAVAAAGGTFTFFDKVIAKGKG